MTRGPNKKGTIVYASSCRVYKVSTKFNYVHIALCIRIYNNTTKIHMIISAFGVVVNTFRLPDRIPWISTSRCEKMRPKQETRCCADRSDIGRWRSHT